MAAIGAIPSAQPRKRKAQVDIVPVEDKSSTPDGDMNGINRATAEMQQISRVERMRQYFVEQPKERVKIRKELGEQTVQINGYSFQIQAGVWVKVPTDVAEILRDAEII
jgi:hypothetical protein